jgi:hypothetical protein
MASVADGLMKLFRSSSASQGAAQPAKRLTRRSSGLAELARMLQSEESLCVMDLGSTSPANIRYLTEKGHKIYSEDLLTASQDAALVTQDDQGNTILDSKRFLDENLVYPASQFDVVLCWNLADYMDESLVKPVMARLWTVMKPGGMLLAFFHTKEAGPDAACYRFHIQSTDTLEMQLIELRREQSKAARASNEALRLQRVFNNRNIENLFRDFGSIKFFLARDNVREVLVVR